MASLVSWLVGFFRAPAGRRRDFEERARRQMETERERLERLRVDRIGLRIPPFAV